MIKWTQVFKGLFTTQINGPNGRIRAEITKSFQHTWAAYLNDEKIAIGNYTIVKNKVEQKILKLIGTTLDSNKQTKVSIMKISKERVIAVLAGLGFKTASKMTDARLKSKVKTLPKSVDEGTVIEPDAANKDLKALLKAIDKGDEVEITAGKEKAADSKKKAPKKEKAKAAPKKEKAKKDKFGAREGSLAAKVNKVITKKPKTMAQIKEAVGTDGTFYNHMKKLIEAGFVEKTDKGYKLK